MGTCSLQGQTGKAKQRRRGNGRCPPICWRLEKLRSLMPRSPTTPKAVGTPLSFFLKRKVGLQGVQYCQLSITHYKLHGMFEERVVLLI